MHNRAFTRSKICAKSYEIWHFITDFKWIFKRSPFQFAWKNSFIHKIDQDFILVSENNEEIDDYAVQDLEIMNTMEATKHFWWENYNF